MAVGFLLSQSIFQNGAYNKGLTVVVFKVTVFHKKNHFLKGALEKKKNINFILEHILLKYWNDFA